MATPIAIKPDHKKFSSLYNTVAVTFFPYLYSCRRSYSSNLGGIPLKKSSRATLIAGHKGDIRSLTQGSLIVKKSKPTLKRLFEKCRKCLTCTWQHNDSVYTTTLKWEKKKKEKKRKGKFSNSKCVTCDNEMKPSFFTAKWWLSTIRHRQHRRVFWKVAVSRKLIVNNIRNVRQNLSVFFTTRQTSKRIW